MLKLLISTVLLMMFAGSCELIFFLFVLSFLISLKCGHDFFLNDHGYMMGMDYLSYALILLSVWIVALMICSSQKIDKTSNFWMGLF